MSRSLVSETNGQYQFEIEYRSANRVKRESLHSRDFARAIFETNWRAVQAGKLPEYQPRFAAAQIVPEFRGGKECLAEVSAFRVVLPEASFSVEFSLSYFRSKAIRFAASVRRSESDAQPSEPLRYSVSAMLDDPGPAAITSTAGRQSLAISECCPSTPLTSVDLSSYAQQFRWDKAQGGSPRIVIYKSVIDDALAFAASDPEVEVGGMLCGRLCRDQEAGEVFVEVSGFIDIHSEASTATSVEFSPAAFQRVQDVIRMRRRGELVVGWMHSHTIRLCGECPLPVPAECVEKVLFFSQADIDLMETTFEHPYMVGLLVALEPRLSDALGHPPVRLFAYDRGRIVPRQMEIVEPC